MSAGQYLNKFTFRTMELFNVHRYVHHLCMVQEWRVISPLICYADVSQEEHICYVDVGHVCIFAKWWPNLHRRLFDRSGCVGIAKFERENLLGGRFGGKYVRTNHFFPCSWHLIMRRRCREVKVNWQLLDFWTSRQSSWVRYSKLHWV